MAESPNTGAVSTASQIWEGEKTIRSQRLEVQHFAAADTLTVLESGKVITNLGAAGAIEIGLPQTAGAGIFYRFVVMVAQELRIAPGAAGAIYIAAAKQTDDKYITANAIAESVDLVSDGNGDWIARSPVGTWGVEA